MAGYPAALRRCRSCRLTVRMLWVPPDEVLAALQERRAPTGELEELQAQVAELRESLADAQAELQRDRREHLVADVVEAEDLAQARAVVQGWRLRLALVRTQKRSAAALAPVPEDLAVLLQAAGA